MSLFDVCRMKSYKQSWPHFGYGWYVVTIGIGVCRVFACYWSDVLLLNVVLER